MLVLMRGRCIVLFALAGCGFRFDLTPGDAGGTDTVVDVSGLDPDADISVLCTTWNAEHFGACGLATPGSPLDLDESHSPYVYDTTVSGGQLRDNTNTVIYESTVSLTQMDQSMVALANIEGFRLRANAVLNVIGTKPLLIASWSTITIDGTIDAGSHATETDANANIWSTTRVGAGANVDCGARSGGIGTNALSSGGSGGGGGGALNGSGGGGAGGDQCANNCPRAGGAGGMKLAAAPTTIRGGCPGGMSGTTGSGAQPPSMSSSLSAGGGGGGAIELSARTGIVITGNVLAGGAGAASGGGGGGSGGYIGLDSTSVMVTGVVAANGGGGGGSGPFSDVPARGFPGADGQGSATAAAGGDGGSLHPAPGLNAGFVMVFSAGFDASNGTISPAPTMP